MNKIKDIKMPLIFIAFITNTVRRVQDFTNIQSLVRHEEQL